MGAPKEVWVNSYGGHPNGVVYAYRAEVEAARCLQEGGTMARYVLARPKREAVAWVVAAGDGFACANDDLSGWATGVGLQFAHRFEASMRGRDRALECARAVGGRVVKLVRPVKP